MWTNQNLRKIYIKIACMLLSKLYYSQSHHSHTHLYNTISKYWKEITITIKKKQYRVFFFFFPSPFEINIEYCSSVFSILKNNNFVEVFDGWTKMMGHKWCPCYIIIIIILKTDHLQRSVQTASPAEWRRKWWRCGRRRRWHGKRGFGRWGKRGFPNSAPSFLTWPSTLSLIPWWTPTGCLLLRQRLLSTKD